LKIILNEQEILDDILNSGKFHKNKLITIRVLAKHYFNIGQDKKQIIDSIHNQLKNNLKSYVYSKWKTVVDSTVKYISKCDNTKLIYIDHVPIYKSELETIKNIKNLRLEKLAFVLLVYAKIYNVLNNSNSNWVNSEQKDIFSDTKMAVKTIDQSLMFNKLINLELLKPSLIVDCTNIKVLYLESDKTAEIELQ
jgi:hypothetical protein